MCSCFISVVIIVSLLFVFGVWGLCYFGCACFELWFGWFLLISAVPLAGSVQTFAEDCGASSSLVDNDSDA